LANLGYEVAAVTGRPEAAKYLKSLGATQIVAREDINETVKRPLESESWAGCIDAVGGAMLARILGQMKYGASVASVGLAGGANLPATVLPFLLRGVNLLGIDSVMQPYAPYAASRLGGEEMDEARAGLAAMMGVVTDELSFGPSTT
jgi:acrylyl-CoA reductase (NADPH)